MRSIVDRLPATRWLLPILVVVLVLSHVCELPAYVELASHHATEANADEQLSSCDAVPATSSPGHGPVWAPPDMAFALAVVDPTPVCGAARSFEDPVRLIERLPLFLLHASLLI